MNDHLAGSATGADSDLFSRLEQSVDRLVERHGVERRTSEALRAELQARDEQIAELSVRVRELEELRERAARGVDGLLERVQAIEAGRAAANGDARDGAAGDSEGEA